MLLYYKFILKLNAIKIKSFSTECSVQVVFKEEGTKFRKSFSFIIFEKIKIKKIFFYGRFTVFFHTVEIPLSLFQVFQSNNN